MSYGSESLGTALRFLTRIPLPVGSGAAGSEPKELVGSITSFPLVGAILGGVLVATDSVLGGKLPPLAVNTILLAVTALLTGGMHLDGLMDSADGLFGGRTPERRLEIMRDSRVGSYGVQAGALVLVLKLGLLSAFEPGARIGLLIAFPACGRWAMAIVMGYYPYPREGGGLGRTFTEGAGARERAAVTVVLLLILGASALLGLPLIQALLAVAASGLVAHALARRAAALVGGVTGDVFGAINEVAEIVFLLVINLAQR